MKTPKTTLALLMFPGPKPSGPVYFYEEEAPPKPGGYRFLGKETTVTYLVHDGDVWLPHWLVKPILSQVTYVGEGLSLEPDGRDVHYKGADLQQYDVKGLASAIDRLRARALAAISDVDQSSMSE